MSQPAHSIPNHEWSIATLPSPVDQLHLRYAVFKSRTVEPRRYIVFLNGRTEWIEKYNPLPLLLELPPGYGFLTWDHRGQGGSEGAAAHVDSYRDYSEDAAAIIDHVVGEREYGMIAHSMGGLIALYGTLREQFRPTFLTLCSPLLMLPNTPIPRSCARVMSEILSLSPIRYLHTGVQSSSKLRFHNNKLTHEPTAFKHLQNAPFSPRTPTFGWIKASFAATQFVSQPKNLGKLRCPSLIIFGSEEQVVDYHGFSQWVQEAQSHSSAHVEMIKISGARHELLNEIPRYRDQAIRHIVRWAQKHHFFNVRPVD